MHRDPQLSFMNRSQRQVAPHSTSQKQRGQDRNPVFRQIAFSIYGGSYTKKSGGFGTYGKSQERKLRFSSCSRGVPLSILGSICVLECSHILGGQWLRVDLAGAAVLLSRSPQSCLNKGSCSRFVHCVTVSGQKLLIAKLRLCNS